MTEYKTPKWKLNRLPDGQWLARHPGCPPHRHICFRGLVRGTLCGVRETLPLAYRLAASRYRYEVYENYRLREELMPPPGWAAGPPRAVRDFYTIKEQ